MSRLCIRFRERRLEERGADLRGKGLVPEFGDEFFGFYGGELADCCVLRVLQDVDEDGDAEVGFVKVVVELFGCAFEDLGVLRRGDFDEQMLYLR
jgi:hypothetical protein